METLKEKAKKLGLWNMFLPKNHFTQGAGFSNLEYGLMAELLGKSKVASEVSYSFLHNPLMLGAPLERMQYWPN
jgi:alkylation response protein AidB-like acyl-CoA dehydrogenase